MENREFENPFLLAIGIIQVIFYSITQIILHGWPKERNRHFHIIQEEYVSLLSRGIPAPWYVRLELSLLAPAKDKDFCECGHLKLDHYGEENMQFEGCVSCWYIEKKILDRALVKKFNMCYSYRMDNFKYLTKGK